MKQKIIYIGEEECKVKTTDGGNPISINFMEKTTKWEDVPEKQKLVILAELKELDPVVEVIKANEPTTEVATIPEQTLEKTQDDLTITEIKKYICTSATDSEAYTFLKLCQARKLNPFTGEAYMIKYGSGAAQTVVGKEAFTRRAEEHRAFDGFQAGIIIENQEGSMEQIEGTFYQESAKLIGGWAKVYRKDRAHPFMASVSLKEYGSGKSLWASKPATMIRKVALVQALREAFPSELGGMYDKAEMGE